MTPTTKRPSGRLHNVVRRFRRDDNGATAVEFALVSIPFMMLLFGIMAICFYFFKTYTVENAVWAATRDIRTGAMQTGTGTWASLDIWDSSTPPKIDETKLKKEFKKIVCAKAFMSTTDCTNDVRVLVQAKNEFGGVSGLSQPQCLAGGTLKSEAVVESEFNAGGASSVVMVTACYQWTFAQKLPFLHFSNMTNGARLIMGSAAFRTEPYN